MISYFTLSKVFWWLIAPSRVFSVLLLISAGLLMTRFWRFGRGLLLGLVSFGLLVTIVPFGQWSLAYLEDRFPVQELPDRVDGIIVLGGALSPQLSSRRGVPVVGGDMERVFSFIYLARRYPEARLVYTGGSGSLSDQTGKEADVARIFFDRLGLDIGPVIFENQSRNTIENALFSKKLVNPQPKENWVLITSAAHMPRAMGVFHRQGWSVLAYPVGHQTDGFADVGFNIDFVRGVRSIAAGMREWIGLAVYYMRGDTDDLFPAP